MQLCPALAILFGCALLGCATMSPEGKHDWSEEPHHISMLLAGTFEEEEEASTLGLDYEYRAGDYLGVGAVVERAFGEIDATTLLGVADLHCTDEFVVQTGPGIEFLDGEQELVYRIGLLYEFEEGGWTVSPQLHYDWIEGEDAVIFGFAFGVGF